MTSIVLLSFLIFFNFGFQQDKTNEFESDIIKVAIVAKDLKATLDFYINVIGMTQVREFDIDNETSTRFGLSGGIPFHVTALKLNNTTQATELKITSFEKRPEQKKSKYIQDAIGVQYLTIYVKSIKPFVERIKANNVKFLGQTPTSADDVYQFILIQDPNGVFIELIGKE
jgi:catechol 2,3-dioxygenase-like lactoylglutathione lyase family enzyme